MEPTENQEVVTETVATEEISTATEPDLSQVEVVSNGQKVDLTASEGENSDDKAAESEEKVATPNPDDAVQKEVNEAKATTEQVKQLVTDKGLNFDELQRTYDEAGALTEAQYTELEAAGYPKAAVDACIAGLQATADKFVGTVKEYAGGTEGFDRMATFVKSQGDAQVAAFNAIMTTADLPTIKEYLNGVKAQMVVKSGTANGSVLGSATSGATQGFSNVAEMTKAMADTRYGRDAKYTQSVEARVAASSIF